MIQIDNGLSVQKAETATRETPLLLRCVSSWMNQYILAFTSLSILLPTFAPPMAKEKYEVVHYDYKYFTFLSTDISVDCAHVVAPVPSTTVVMSQERLVSLLLRSPSRRLNALYYSWKFAKWFYCYGLCSIEAWPCHTEMGQHRFRTLVWFFIT